MTAAPTVYHTARQRAPHVSRGKRAVVAPTWYHEIVVSGQGWAFTYVWSDERKDYDRDKVLNSHNVKRAIQRHTVNEQWWRWNTALVMVAALLTDKQAAA